MLSKEVISIAGGRSEKLGVQVVMQGILEEEVLLLFLPKFGGAVALAPLATIVPPALNQKVVKKFLSS